MYETDILYRLSLMVGFLTAGFLAILIGAAVAALRYWYKSGMKDLNRMIDDIEKLEEACKNDKDT